MIKAKAAVVFAMGVGIVSGQDSSSSGQSWVGLLVAGSCTTPSSTQAGREADLTTSSRTTTPAVDNSGTRGSSSMLDPDAKEPAGTGRDVPHTGDIQAALPKGLTDPGWVKAKKQAKSLGSACGVTSATNRFALLLPDGSTLAFDDLANVAVQKQLPDNLSSGKVFRVKVTGKLQKGTIALDSIRL